MNFAHLKNGKNTQELDNAWENLRPQVQQILSDMNRQLFEDKWSMEFSLKKDDKERIHIHHSFPSPTNNLIALKKTPRIFVLVCLHENGKTVRIYTGLDKKFVMQDNVAPNDFERSFTYVATNLVELLGI